MAIKIEHFASGTIRIEIERPRPELLRGLLNENFAKVVGMVIKNEGADGKPLPNPMTIRTPDDPGMEWLEGLVPPQSWFGTGGS